MTNLSGENYLYFAIKAYNCPHFIEQEFHSDLKRAIYIKRLIQKYRKNGILKERLILNHIIMFYNVFDTESATKILFYRIRENDFSILKTFLSYLNYMPEAINSINGKIILSANIPLDEELNNRLKFLWKR